MRENIFQYFMYIRAIEISCSVELSMKKFYTLETRSQIHVHVKFCYGVILQYSLSVV